MFIAIVLAVISVSVGLVISNKIEDNLIYYFLEDSNKILAVFLAVCAFVVFLNFEIPYSRIINNIAKSTFGVLLIHANSDIMRKWLWTDLLDCTTFYNSSMFFVHAVCSVIGVYIACVIIELLRIYFIEKPFFKFVNSFRRKRE